MADANVMSELDCGGRNPGIFRHLAPPFILGIPYESSRPGTGREPIQRRICEDKFFTQNLYCWSVRRVTPGLELIKYPGQLCSGAICSHRTDKTWPGGLHCDVTKFFFHEGFNAPHPVLFQWRQLCRR